MKSEDYGEDYQSHLLEQYKLYVEMADRVSQRRDQSNRFYVTIVSALAAIVVIIARLGVSEGRTEVILSSNGAFLAAGLFGLALSAVWFFNIRSYRALNNAKFKIIHRMEKRLPIAAYKEEWKIARPPKKNRPYFQLTRVEQFVPVIFMALSVALAAYAIYLLSI